MQWDYPEFKLDARNIGPYKIEKIKSPLVCQLDLPPSLRIFPLFHVNLLTRAATDPMPTQLHQPRPPVVSADGVENWYVDAILDSRINCRRRNLLEYLVQWEENQQPTWEPWDLITGADDALDAFHDQHPTKPRPHQDRQRAPPERST